jgi:hypothetical protein
MTKSEHALKVWRINHVPSLFVLIIGNYPLNKLQAFAYNLTVLLVATATDKISIVSLFEITWFAVDRVKCHRSVVCLVTTR